LTRGLFYCTIILNRSPRGGGIYLSKSLKTFSTNEYTFPPSGLPLTIMYSDPKEKARTICTV
jgi:hypothetical protein